MTKLEKIVIGSLPISPLSLSYCETQIKMQQDALRETVNEFYASQQNAKDYKEFSDSCLVASSIMSWYRLRKNILIAELALLALEVEAEILGFPNL